MGVLEELAAADDILFRRINALERLPSAEDLKVQQDRLMVEQQRLTAEHQAIGRRMHAIESESNQAQHHEIQALGRRVSAIEDLNERVSKLRDALGALIGQQAVSHQEAINGVRIDLLQVQAALGQMRAQMEAHHDRSSGRIAALEAWYVAQQTWNAQPWWVRWWRRIKGERP